MAGDAKEMRYLNGRLICDRICIWNSTCSWYCYSLHAGRNGESADEGYDAEFGALSIVDIRALALSNLLKDVKGLSPCTSLVESGPWQIVPFHVASSWHKYKHVLLRESMSNDRNI